MQELKTPHTATNFDQDLETLSGLVLEMGGVVEQLLAEAMQALSENDPQTARQVIASDKQVNALELKVDAECIRILALHQPMASDLRLVTTTLKLIADLERIGDELKKVAKQVMLRTIDLKFDAIVKQIVALGEEVRIMLHDALDAFARSEDIHSELHTRDSAIDEKCRALMESVLVEAAGEPNDVQHLEGLLSIVWILRSLERVGDHTKNIGEYTSYLLGGKDIRHPDSIV